ncbi:MAG: ornithine cyclodeaminase family protein [Deltaproteobacteria bacterium]|nr:ornithine cyclodeaminase family protein [Deltaproteobacteria bacterium]
MSLLLSASEIMRVLNMDLALAAVHAAFLACGEGRVNNPPKSHLNVGPGSFKAIFGEITMPSGHICGVKWNANFPENPWQGRFAVMGKLLLNDPETGLELADMDATHITNYRTGAAGGLAVQHLARKNAARLGLVGAGEQARTQAEAILKIRPIREVTVYSRTSAHAQALGNELAAKYGLEVRVADEEKAAVAGQDIVVSTTPATHPHLLREWVAPGTHINAVGADSPGKQELEPAILKAARVVVDDLAQCREIGEINMPLRRGEFSLDQVYGTLGKIVAGKKPGRAAPQEITVFDATGLAIQDLSLGWEILQRAREMGLGEEKSFLQ